MWGETALNRRGYTPSERFLNLLQAGFVYIASVSTAKPFSIPTIKFKCTSACPRALILLPLRFNLAKQRLVGIGCFPFTL
jgi:hypothetical protein